MNLLASYNWIKEYVSLRETPEQFARKLSLSGPSVERSYPQAPPFDKMVVGVITSIAPHPQADKLRVVATDIGGEVLELVCGGVNLSVGMKVAVALVGSKVRWHGQGDLVELQLAEIRGVKSAGMICGANEIGLADAFPHAEKEILDLTWCKAKAGTPLAKALDLEDTVFDIEVTTNRPDAFAIIGLAREAAAILGSKFLWREGVVPTPAKAGRILPLAVKNQAPKVCTKYLAVVMDNLCAGPSPWWLKSRLRQAGLRSVNAIVDITNYVMLEYGQPMHAFDYEQLAGKSIVVRHAQAGEKLKTLDGVEHDLAGEQVVIADGEKPVAVAGVMGGEHSGVTDKTTTIVFECATFDPVAVRRTARALNLHTDSSLRYEKGLPEELTRAALARAVELCQKVACGRVASKVIEVGASAKRRRKWLFRPAAAEAVIGVRIPRPRMVGILKSLGFGVTPKSKIGDIKYEVTVPYWRARDIEDERDFAEEIARVYGYANLPSEIPSGRLPLAPTDPLLVAEDRAKVFLAAAGFTELLQYSLVSREILEKAGV
ncbi:phenylalanine--tRNA ligase subunit beta, partial [Candidatus Uhrbacteria bacterium RIFCSPHIGHO2_02_FULL_60_10]